MENPAFTTGAERQLRLRILEALRQPEISAEASIRSASWKVLLTLVFLLFRLEAIHDLVVFAFGRPRLMMSRSRTSTVIILPI